MSLLDLARRKTADEIRELVEDLEAGRVPTEEQDRLKELVRQTPEEEQAEAIEENPAIADLFDERALNLRPPDTFGMPDQDVSQPEEDVEVEIEEEPAEEEPQAPGDEPEFLEGVPQPDATPERGGRAAGGGRLSNLPERFPQPHARAEYQSMENARQNANEGREQDVSPSRFWDQFEERILGRNHIITKQEFVDGKQSPGTTGQFK